MLKKILSEIVLVCIVIALITGSYGCNGSGTKTSSQTTSNTIITTTSTSDTSTSISTSTTTMTTNTVATTGTSILLTPSGEVVEATGTVGFLFSNPARVGVRLSGTMAVMPFSQYPTLEVTGELYTVKITLLEVMRGKNALDYLSDFGLFSGFPYYKSLPETGYEYTLATMKFEYYMRDLPGDLIYKMGQGDFMCYSQDNVEYNTPFILPWKTDIWDYDITPGDVIEIKIATMVSIDDEKPTMLFKKGEKWIGLY